MDAGANPGPPTDPRLRDGAKARLERAHVNMEQDGAWLQKMSGRQNVKPLVEGVTTILSLLRKGPRGRDAPIEQVAQMRRLLCYEYAKTDVPFDMQSPSGGTPRCIAMLYMFGKPLIYYCEAESLVRMVAVAGPDSVERTIAAIAALFAKAKEDNASVAIFFALGVCAEVETMHWEARTVRKTAKGRIKDGELMFSNFDLEPREAGCTCESEHWDTSLFQLLRRRMLANALPICLDVQPEEGPTINRCLSREELFEMCEMLKAQRVKLLASHKREMGQMRVDHQAQMFSVVEELAQDKAKLELLLDEEKGSRARAVSKVAEQAARSEESVKERMRMLEEEHAKMKEVAFADKKSAMDAYARVEGMKLEQKEAQTKFKARESALEAQVQKLRQDQTKAVVESTRTLSELKKKHAAELQELRKAVSDGEKKVAGQRAAASAVSASAEEARRRALALEQALETRNSIGHGYQRVALGLLRIASVRHAEMKAQLEARCDEMREERETVKRQRKEDMAAAAQECSALRADAGALRAELQTSIDACVRANEELAAVRTAAAEVPAQPTPREEELASDVERLEEELRQIKAREKQHTKKAKQDEHMVSELQKVKGSLERRLVESERQVERLKREAHVATVAAASTATVAGPQPSDGASTALVPDPSASAPVSPPPLLGVPPTQQPFAPSPFPQQPWLKDDAFEGLVSSMYGTLSSILATARTAPGHRRAVDELQIKNDMLLEELRNKNDMIISMTSGMPPPASNSFMGGAYMHTNSSNGVGNNGYAHGGGGGGGGGGRMGGHGKHGHQQQQQQQQQQHL